MQQYWGYPRHFIGNMLLVLGVVLELYVGVQANMRNEWLWDRWNWGLKERARSQRSPKEGDMKKY